MKKVLFVTFFWPPSGKATVHWPLGMARHLPSFGWQPYVLTADKDSFSQADPSLTSEVLPSVQVERAKAFEPFGLYRALLGKDKNEPLLASEAISLENRSIAHRLSIWIRMNLFVPDARVGWYWGAVRSGRKFLQTQEFDAIISIGPPHTAHLVAKTLSKDFGIAHIPVFIDPWVDIVYYKDFKRNPLALALDRRMEKSVLEDAHSVVFVTKSMQEHYQRKYKWLASKSHLLYWGFDEEDFRNLKPQKKGKEEILLHTGNIFDYQNPAELWKTISREVKKRRNLRLVFVGTVSPGIKRAIKEAGLEPRTTYKGFVPYKQVIKELMRASYLLVCATEPRHVPGKLFEYLRAGKPILAFGDDNSEVERILNDENAGMIFPYKSDPSEFFRGVKRIKPQRKHVGTYARENITADLASILDKLIATPSQTHLVRSSKKRSAKSSIT